MPPKRRNKAPTKPVAATPPSKPTPAGGIRHSSVKRRRSSVSLKTSTSRLQPSEPLHMTTRGAAKAASNNTSPAAPSIANGSSRRSSLNSVAHFEDQPSDIEDERPAKRSRVSTDSGSPPNQMGSFVSQLPVVDDSESKSASRAASNASRTSGRKRRASGASSESSKTVSHRPNGIVTRSESDLSEKQPRRKKRKTNGATPEPPEGPPELTDGSSPAGSPEAILEVPSSQGLQNALSAANSDVPAKTARRLPGRRRQPHADINVETHLRRQLSLKMGYRSLAKIQKAMLDELSTRTTTNLEHDPEFHKQTPEYQHVMAQLDQRRQSRIDQIDADRRLKLEQLERVRVAEEHIQKEQYINRFKEIQNDMLMQCYYRLKQIQRQMKAASENATDDEDNVIDPSYLEFPAYNEDDRVGSKYASRSRAYVETERMMQEEDLRGVFGRQRKEFMEENEDLDDSIDNIPGGFATFTGPDRTEALAHYKVAALVDAAAELDKMPLKPETPEVIVEEKVIPNEQANALFLLASISSERRSEAVFPKQEPHFEAPAPVATPAQQVDVQRQTSPFAPLSVASTAMSLETAKSTPMRPLEVKEYRPPTVALTSPVLERYSEPTKQEPALFRTTTSSRASTNRIMDLLNDPQEVPTLKARDIPPVIRETLPGPEVTRPSQQTRPESLGQTQQPPQYGIVRMDTLLQGQGHDHPPRPRSTGLEGPLRRTHSPAPADQYWSSTTSRRPSDSSGPGEVRHHLDHIRHMFDRKPEQNRVPQRQEASPRDGHVEYVARRASIDKAGMAPPYSRPFSPSERPTTDRESRKPSVSTYSASPSSAPLQYEQSPRDRHLSYNPPPRQNSFDQGSRTQWEGGRRLSGSQAPHSQPSSQYAGSPLQPYASDFGRSGPTPPARQSPYAPPSAPHLPPHPASSLPPKSSDRPTVYRFAHYDPVPPGPPKGWPNQPPGSHAPVSHPPPTAGPHPQPAAAPHTQPPASAAPQPISASPHPSQYPNPYPPQPQYQGYVPPPGSFQAPPPPQPPSQPPSQLNASSPYPPLKIHQYGGQPILPANMAPPPSSHPTHPPHSAPPHSAPPHSAPPPSYNQSPPAPAYSQPAAPQQQPQTSPPVPATRPPFEISHAPGLPAQVAPHERPDNGPRPRRQYRSWHAPGTEFRTYQGPKPGRRPT